MKSFYTKSKLIAILTISLFSASVNGQDLEVAPPSKIIQELMLIDNKISFNAEQMDVNSVKVTVIKEVEKKLTLKCRSLKMELLLSPSISVSVKVVII